MIKKGIAILVFTSLVLGLIWNIFFSLKEVPLPTNAILGAYNYETPQNINFKLTPVAENERQFNFSYTSFDGDTVNGRISYPNTKSNASYPVLIGVSAMGRNYQRWWVDAYKGRATVTQVNKIGRLATERGYVLVSIDARFHGSRKNPERTLRSIMNDVHIWGDKTDYEHMIVGTVKDTRILLDWIEAQPNLDNEHIAVAGYSMGAQISLLLSSLDNRIAKTLAIVPPFIDDKLAVAAPKNLLQNIKNEHVWLLSATDDETASEQENDLIYGLIPSANKKHMKLDGGHILPENYPAKIIDWLDINNNS